VYHHRCRRVGTFLRNDRIGARKASRRNRQRRKRYSLDAWQRGDSLLQTFKKIGAHSRLRVVWSIEFEPCQKQSIDVPSRICAELLLHAADVARRRCEDNERQCDFESNQCMAKTMLGTRSRGAASVLLQDIV